MGVELLGGLSALCLCGGSPLDSVEVYDPATGEWSVAAALATARAYHSFATLDGKLWVMGGRGADRK